MKSVVPNYPHTYRNGFPEVPRPQLSYNTYQTVKHVLQISPTTVVHITYTHLNNDEQYNSCTFIAISMHKIGDLEKNSTVVVR